VTTKSTIVVKGDSFVSGSDMTVVVTLKDAQGNLVSGHEELLDNGVAVPNATLKTNTHWTESSTEVGVYNATYVAVTASINQTATLRLGSSSVPSGTYAITPGAPAQEASAISVDGARYLSGGVLAVMVTLKDAAGNSISGEESKLATVVKVPNTEPKEAWVDKGDGVYGATYTATVVGDNLKATLALNGWSGPRESGAYRIVLDGIAGVQVNGYRFGADAGFPTTGFAGAKFTFELKEGKAADYTWSSSAPWVSVNDNGEVSFTGQGNGQRVTLTGTAKSGGGAITYSFQLKRWFTNKGDQAMTWSKANMTCRLPKASEVANSRTLEILGGGTPILTGPTRVVGNLWGEWGGKALSELYPPDRNNSIARWLGDATIAGLTGRTYGEGPFIIDPFFGSIGASNGGYSTAAPMCVEDF
ncbi:TPA: hypothetical protein KEU15_002601, partial [Serratia marcescens]|nr:hypothetical protein [Serratia marcescens]